MTNTIEEILSGNAEKQADNTQETSVSQPEMVPETESENQVELDVDGQEPNSGGQKMVPQEALHAEKQKVKRYTEQVADFQKSLAERDAVWQRRFDELTSTLAARQPGPEMVDPYADLDGALNQRLTGAITPIASTISDLKTQVMRINAVTQHGPEKVAAFEQYVNEAFARGDPDMQILSAQMRASPDPMATGLKWFEQRTFDPSVERERIKQEVLAELQKEAPAQQQRQSVMPSNLAGARSVGSRSGPAWSGPPTLDDIFKR